MLSPATIRDPAAQRRPGAGVELLRNRGRKARRSTAASSRGMSLGPQPAITIQRRRRLAAAQASASHGRPRSRTRTRANLGTTRPAKATPPTKTATFTRTAAAAGSSTRRAGGRAQAATHLGPTGSSRGAAMARINLTTSARAVPTVAGVIALVRAVLVVAAVEVLVVGLAAAVVVSEQGDSGGGDEPVNRGQ